MLYNGSGYELFFAEYPVYSSVKWKETIKIWAKFKNKSSLIPILAMLTNFSLDVLYGGGSKIHCQHTLHIGGYNDDKIKGSIKHFSLLNSRA